MDIVIRKKKTIDDLEKLLRIIHDITPSHKKLSLRVVDEAIRYIEKILAGEVERFGYPEESDGEVVDSLFHVIGMNIDSLFENNEDKQDILFIISEIRKKIEDVKESK